MAAEHLADFQQFAADLVANLPNVEWPELLEPQKVLNQLRKAVNEETIPFVSRLPKCYVEWEKMNGDQKNKTKIFFNEQSIEFRRRIVEGASNANVQQNSTDLVAYHRLDCVSFYCNPTQIYHLLNQLKYN